VSNSFCKAARSSYSGSGDFCFACTSCEIALLSKFSTARIAREFANRGRGEKSPGDVSTLSAAVIAVTHSLLGLPPLTQPEVRP